MVKFSVYLNRHVFVMACQSGPSLSTYTLKTLFHMARPTVYLMLEINIEPGYSISYKIICVPREDSDQPAHPRSGQSSQDHHENMPI